MRIKQMPKVTLMPDTTVKAFLPQTLDIEQDGVRMTLEAFQTVILSSGTVPAPGPDEEIRKIVPKIEVIRDAREPHDIFTATQAGYRLAQSY
jgi:hypothetical protein